MPKHLGRWSRWSIARGPDRHYEEERLIDTDRPKEELYPDLFPKDFGRRLERLTEIAGLSWGEFAARLGVNEGRVMEWLNGTIPTGGEVWRIAHLAGSVPGGMDLLLAEDEEW